MNISKPATEQVELIFEGLIDSAPETARRVKCALLDSFHLSVEEAKAVLDNAPIAVQKSADVDELKPLFDALKEAGGKVALVRLWSECLEDNNGNHVAAERSSFSGIDAEIASFGFGSEESGSNIEQLDGFFDDLKKNAVIDPHQEVIDDVAQPQEAPDNSLGRAIAQGIAKLKLG